MKQRLSPRHDAENGDLDQSVLKGMSPSGSSCHNSGNSSEEEAEKVEEPKGIEDIKETKLLKHI